MSPFNVCYLQLLNVCVVITLDHDTYTVISIHESTATILQSLTLLFRMRFDSYFFEQRRAYTNTHLCDNPIKKHFGSQELNQDAHPPLIRNPW